MNFIERNDAYYGKLTCNPGDISDALQKMQLNWNIDMNDLKIDTIDMFFINLTDCS